MRSAARKSGRWSEVGHDDAHQRDAGKSNPFVTICVPSRKSIARSRNAGGCAPAEPRRRTASRSSLAVRAPGKEPRDLPLDLLDAHAAEPEIGRATRGARRGELARGVAVVAAKRLVLGVHRERNVARVASSHVPQPRHWRYVEWPRRFRKRIPLPLRSRVRAIASSSIGLPRGFDRAPRGALAGGDQRHAPGERPAVHAMPEAEEREGAARGALAYLSRLGVAEPSTAVAPSRWARTSATSRA